MTTLGNTNIMALWADSETVLSGDNSWQTKNYGITGRQRNTKTLGKATLNVCLLEISHFCIFTLLALSFCISFFLTTLECNKKGMGAVGII